MCCVREILKLVTLNRRPSRNKGLPTLIHVDELHQHITMQIWMIDDEEHHYYEIDILKNHLMKQLPAQRGTRSLKPRCAMRQKVTQV